MDVKTNNDDLKKQKRREYMREYMKKRNVKLRGEPRKPLTEQEKKERIKISNHKQYMKNRDKHILYARKKREQKTGMTNINKIKKLFNTLTDDEKRQLNLSI